MSGTGKKAKVKIGKFGQKIGFPGVGRRPQRNELLLLQSQVAIYQPSEQAAQLALVLNQALIALDGSGNRGTLIANANRIAKEVRDELDKLKKEKEEAEKRRKEQQPSKSQLKSMKQVRDELTKELRSALEEMNEDLGKIKLAPELAPTALRAGGETIRREIGAGDPNEVSGSGTRADDIRKEIDGLRRRIARANLKHENENIFMTTSAVRQTTQAEELLKRFDEAVGGAYEGPLRRTVEVLKMNLTAVPADPVLIRMLLIQVSVARQAARKQPGFVTDTHRQGVEAKNSEEMVHRLESMLEPLRDNLEFLRQAEAPGYDAIQDALNELRTEAHKPIANDKIADATLAMRSKVDELFSEAEKQRGTVEDIINHDGEAAQQMLLEAKQQYETQHRLHGDAKALESDWKAIEALLGSTEQILPATGALPKGLSAKDVALAQDLTKKAAARLNDIKDNTGPLLTFDDDVKELAKALDTRSFFAKLKGNARGTLEKYNPKQREALDKRLDALVKGLPVTPAKTSMETFKTLKEEAEQAVIDLTPTVDYIEETADPFYNEMKAQRISWVMAERDPPPKEFDDALNALEAQLMQKPPAKAALEQAVQTGRAALDKASNMSPEEWLDAYKTEQEEKARASRENETRRSAEGKLLKRLEDKYDATKIAVESVDGDTNALAAAQRLIGQIKSDIEKNTFDRLESRRKDLEARLNLLLSDPRGEANRRRSELPGVIEELRGAIDASARSLEQVSDDIDKYAAQNADEEDAKKNAEELLAAYVRLLKSEVDDMADAARPILNPKTHDEDARRQAREEGLRILRSFRNRLRAQPMTSELLKAPFAEAKSAVAPVFRSLDKYEYTLTTCI